MNETMFARMRREAEDANLKTSRIKAREPASKKGKKGIERPSRAVMNSTT